MRADVRSLGAEPPRGRSGSEHDLVLAFAEALETAAMLESQGVACAGWEGCVRDRDGEHFQHSGFPGELARARPAGEPWADHVRASWEAAREGFRKDQARWDSGWTWPGEKLFFRIRLGSGP